MRRWVVRGLVAVLVILASTAAVLRWGRQPPPLPEGSVSAARLAGEHRATTSFEVTLVDASRPTPANRDAPALPSRTLRTRVWHADEAGPVPSPLVLFSHGFLSERAGATPMAEDLARHGFVVMAADFPLTTLRPPGGANVRDVIHQPGDLSFLIDTAAAWNADPTHPLHGRLRTDDVGAFGVSLGGLTSTLAAYHPTEADPRIRHVVSIAGPLAPLGPTFFQRPGVDFLMLAGRQDAVVPYAFHAAHTLERVPGAVLVEVTDASHTGFSGLGGPMRWLHHPDQVPCALLLRKDPAAPPEPWATVLGTPEQGVQADAPTGLCTLPLTERPLNTLAQQRLTALVVTAFFEATMADDPAVRARAQAFLDRDLPREHADVRVHRSP